MFCLLKEGVSLPIKQRRNVKEGVSQRRNFLLCFFIGAGIMPMLNNFGLYTVNPDYLEFLYKVDSEVYYAPSYRKSAKPFIGIVVLIDNID